MPGPGDDDDPSEEEDDSDDEGSDDEEESSDEDAEEEEEASDDDEEEASADDDGEEDASDDEEGEESADDDEETSDDESEDEEVDEEEGEAEAPDEVEGEADADDAGEIALPEVDDDVFGSRADFEGAEDEDFEDDQGDWSAEDYDEVATTFFGGHEFFGDTAEQRYVAEGFVPIDEDDHEVVRGVRERLPDATTVTFFERDGRVVPRGFLTQAALEVLEAAFPALELALLHVTVPRRRDDDDDGASAPPRRLPPELAGVTPKDSVDLRKYATPIGDQGSTSRCAAFAWTHALEMLGNIQARPFPRLACSFTMYRFQERQGDQKDFRFAWKGGDGTSGTWEPGDHLFRHGTCRHDHWPNDHKEPLASLEQMQADAANHRFDADVYDVSLDEMKNVLSSGLPVQISMATGDAFQDIGRDGVMRVAEAPKGQHGYHAMLCVGYLGNHFIVKNSWGEDWGDGGYCYIPKKVLAESEPEAVAIIPKSRVAPPPAPLPTNGPPLGGGSFDPRAASARPNVASQAREAPPLAPAPAPPPAQGLVACPRCQRSVPSGKFCRECGGPLPAATPARNFCASCGARRTGAGAFCASCGARNA